MGVANEKRDVLLYFWREHKKGMSILREGRDNASLCNDGGCERIAPPPPPPRDAARICLVNWYTLYNKVLFFMSSSFSVVIFNFNCSAVYAIQTDINILF